jgi:hypothetical protein
VDEDARGEGCEERHGRDECRFHRHVKVVVNLAERVLTISFTRIEMDDPSRTSAGDNRRVMYERPQQAKLSVKPGQGDELSTDCSSLRAVGRAAKVVMCTIRGPAAESDGQRRLTGGGCAWCQRWHNVSFGSAEMLGCLVYERGIEP